MGSNCSVDEIFHICNSGEEPPEDSNISKTETSDASNDSENESDTSEDGNRISGLDDPKASNRKIFEVSLARKTTGLFTVDLNDLDVTDLKKNLGRHLVSINIVKGNLLKLTFNGVGRFVIHPTKTEKKDGVLTLHIVDSMENYGGPQPEVESIHSFYRIPKNTHTITCNDMTDLSQINGKKR